MYHYTYLIQHRTTDMRYIGKRSCKCLPEEDTSYWGSSKHLPKDIQKDHVKIILRKHETAKHAIQHEILLHELNDVAKNQSYYNKAKQLSTGFDTTGTKLQFTDEHKQKISNTLTGLPKSETAKKNNSIAQKLLYKNGYINPRTGAVLSDELKTYIKQRKTELQCGVGTNNPKFKPWFISYPTHTTLFYTTTKEAQSIQDGHNKHYYQDLSQKSKGIRPLKHGKMKGCVVGHIPINS